MGDSLQCKPSYGISFSSKGSIYSSHHVGVFKNLKEAKISIYLKHLKRNANWLKAKVKVLLGSQRVKPLGITLCIITVQSCHSPSIGPPNIQTVQECLAAQRRSPSLLSGCERHKYHINTL